MGRIVTLQEAQLLTGQLRDWAYNTLDVTGTREAGDTLLPQLTGNHERIYRFERALQAPAMSMMLRGVRVDQQKRNEMVGLLKQELARDEKKIAKLSEVTEVWDGTEKETGICPAEFGKHHKWPRGMPDGPGRLCERCGAPRIKPLAFNANSATQRAHLFYDLHKVEPEKNKDGEITTDGDALERIGRKYPRLLNLTSSIEGVIDKKKQLGALAAKLTPDGRYPSSFNVGAAWTGRFSSSKNPFQLGGNLQNVAPRHRRVFIADPGMDMFYADYMQGESNIVAHLSGDEKYLEAHRLGDVHTYVTRYIWPDLPWTGDLAKDKKIAKQLPPWDQAEGHDYRFQCKRIQHGSNYGLTPFGISMIAKIPLSEAKLAYERYMTEFDGIPAWHNWVYARVHEHQPLINPLGREITLFGRSWDKHTKRQGLAFLPQSTLADIEDIALWQVWNYLEQEGVYELAQVHDAILGQYPRGDLSKVRDVLGLMSIPVPVVDIYNKTRMMTIGVEAAVGRNWGHKGKDNPYGIDEAPIAEYLNEHPL